MSVLHLHFVLTPLVDGAGFAGMGMAEARPALDSRPSVTPEKEGREGFCVWVSALIGYTKPWNFGKKKEQLNI